uniref:DUF4939 domain-containing protein n=1 Tax=Cyprinus carpio carpio TaxID=630221 RepID=A0A9J8CX94_CYPCA
MHLLPPRTAHLRPVSRSPAASTHRHFLDHRLPSLLPPVVSLGLSYTFLFSINFTFNSCICFLTHLLPLQNALTNYGSSKFHFTLRIHPPQCQPHGSAAGRAVQALVTQVSELTQQIQQLTIPAAPPAPSVPRASTEPSYRPEPRLPVPENYSGEPNYCRTFITKCSMHFSLQPRTFETEESKVEFVLTLLSGRAALWGTAVWENRDPCCASFHSLSEEMKRVFDRAAAGKEAARELTELKQGNLKQWDMFLHGLADRVHKEIYLLELPTSLNRLIDLALRVDARIERLGAHACPTRLPSTLESGSSSRENTVGPVFDHEPMQVGRARLTREERERRRSQGLCLYCGGSGHFLLSCPVKEPAR